MDWYYGSAIDELIVSKDLVLSDRLPSPDSWSKWGIDGTESFPSEFDCGFFVQELSAEEDGFDTKSAFGDAEMEDSVPDKYPSTNSTVCGDFSDDALHGPDYQLDDQAGSGSGRIDDIFVSSLRDQSFFFSPKSQRGTTKFNTYESDVNSELQNASSDVRCPGSSRYLKTHAFSSSLGSDFVSHNLEKEESALVKDPSNGESAPSEKNDVNGDIDDETSLDAAVLLELRMIASQLTEKTRICFRDALYRLSKNSVQHCLFQNQDGDLFMEIPPSTLNAETKRYETRKATESETNIIDRAIANLMFNKMDFNVRDCPNMDASSNDKSYPTQIQNSSHCRMRPDDDEVPLYWYPTENLSRSGKRSGNKSLVLEFGSVA